MMRLPAFVGASSAREWSNANANASRAELAPTNAAFASRSSDLRPRAVRGFTLVELVMVIALAGVVAVLISTVMSNPLQSFADQSRRAELVDKATVALNRMSRDVRLAVPNSLTASSSQIRLLSIAAAGRYRANQPDPSGPRVDPPQCTQAGASCSIAALSPITPAASSTPHWLVIYNTDVGELAAVTSPSVISPKVFTWSSGTLSGTLQNFRFKYASPQHRFYLAREVVGFRCDGSGRLWRSVSENLDGSSPSESLVVDSIAPGGCSFTYDPGTSSRSGLVTLRLVLSQDDEVITLLQQVHVDNAP